jgi:hypothetical protein
MKRILAVSLLIILSTACAVHAGPLTWGGRVGLSVDPDQFVFGAQVEVSEPFPGWVIRPVAELGTGDDIFTLALSGDLLYTFPELATADWQLAVGGGLGFAYYNFDEPRNLPAGVEFDDTASEIGLNIVGAVARSLESGNDLVLELRLGIDELPDFKITAGLTFN